MLINTDVIERKAYLIQQKFDFLLSHNINSITPNLVVVILIGGIFTSLNPCSLSTIPISLSYLNTQANSKASPPAFIMGLTSSVGLIVLFTSFFNKEYHNLVIAIPTLSSFFAILIGLNLLEIIKLDQFQFDLANLNRLPFKYSTKDFLAGLCLGLTSSPCSTPILMTLLLWLTYTDSVFIGFIYLITYLIGYTLPLVLILLFTFKSSYVEVFSKIWRITIPFSGSFVLGCGIFSFLSSVFI